MRYFGTMKKYLVSFFIFICAFTSFSQEKILPIDQSKLVLELNLMPEETRLEARVSIYCKVITATDSIWLDGINISYSSFKWNGVEHAYSSNNKGLWFNPGEVDLQKEHRITIEYGARPRKGLYFRGWYNCDPNPQIWTQGQGIDHRHWIPHQDDQRDKLSTEIMLDFPAEYEVISNGNLLPHTKIPEAGFKHWHYSLKEAHPSYLLFLGIGKYETQWDEVDGQIFQHLLYPKHKALFQSNYGNTAALFTWMQSAIGVDFPWTATYKHLPVANFKHGAMENTSAVAMGDFFLEDSMIVYADRTQLEIQAHEMAHHWFGNSVTALNSSHHWLHEGFATYWQWESKKEFESTFLYQYTREQAAKRVFSQSSRKAVSVSDKKGGSVAFYDKGGWVVFMLKEYIGETAFNAGLIHFLKTNEYGVVQAADLQASMEEQVDYSLQEFFDYWVKGGGEPELTLKVLGKKKKQRLEIHNPSKAPMQLEVTLIHADGRIETRILRLNANEDLLKVDLSGLKLLAVLPDVDSKCLAQWKIELAYKKGMKKLLKLDNIQLRSLTLRYFRSNVVLGSEDIQASLEQSNPAIIWEVLTALPSTSLKEEMLTALSNTDSLLYLVDMYLSINPNPTEYTEKWAQRLWDNPSYKSKEFALSIWFQKNPTKCIQHAKQALDYNEPVVQSLRVAASTYLFLKEEEAGKQQLIQLAMPESEFNTRTMALNSLLFEGKEHFDMNVLEGCIEDYFDPNGRIAKPTRLYVNHFINDKRYGLKVKEKVQIAYASWTDNQKAVFDRLSGWKK